MARVTVAGVIASVNGTGSGFTVLEERESPTRPGYTWKTYWKCWMPRHASYAIPSKGDTVTVIGEWGGRVDEKNARYVDHILNNVTLERTAQPTPQSGNYTAVDDGSYLVNGTPPEDPWGPVATIPNDQDVPF